MEPKQPPIQDPAAIEIGKHSTPDQVSRISPKLDPREQQIQADYEWGWHDPQVRQDFGGQVIAVHGRKVWGVGHSHTTPTKTASQVSSRNGQDGSVTPASTLARAPATAGSVSTAQAAPAARMSTMASSARLESSRIVTSSSGAAKQT